jgi:pSer/pThr/pTyr-binding forkhead associated (FHA) protein
MILETIKRLVLRALRRKTPRPISPPPSASAHPPPTPTGPHLESVGTSGGRCHLDLRPDGVTIGRAPENDLVITQDLPGWETVSRRHARIYEQAGHWIVEDLNSTNGIYVNGKRTGRNLLREGWQLRVGGVEFLFRASTGEERQ